MRTLLTHLTLSAIVFIGFFFFGLRTSAWKCQLRTTVFHSIQIAFASIALCVRLSACGRQTDRHREKERFVLHVFLLPVSNVVESALLRLVSAFQPVSHLQMAFSCNIFFRIRRKFILFLRLLCNSLFLVCHFCHSSTHVWIFSIYKSVATHSHTGLTTSFFSRQRNHNPYIMCSRVSCVAYFNVPAPISNTLEMNVHQIGITIAVCM